RTIIVARDGGSIKIEDNVGISGATIYSRKSIKIGKNTLIGANVKILDNDFHPLDTEARINNRNEFIRSKEIVIGENCFLGTNSIILKGTVLGNNCIVGAGAVVSGKFEDNSIIVGNPGKVIKIK
ncbi:MAG: acyltransferase, partial [Cetobacterium sp.]